MVGHVEVNCTIGSGIQLNRNIEIVRITVFYNCEWELYCCVTGRLIDTTEFLRAGKADLRRFFIFHLNNLSVLPIPNGSNRTPVTRRVGQPIAGCPFHAKGRIAVVWIVIAVNVCCAGGTNHPDVFISRRGIAIFIAADHEWSGNAVPLAHILYPVAAEDLVA